jgi:hypothetical protein
MQKKTVKGGLIPIMYGDTKHCIHCKNQRKILKGKIYRYKQVDLNRLPVKLSNGVVINAVPTWYLPKGGKGFGSIKVGSIKANTLKTRKTTRFGAIANPIINSLATNGKNFPDNKGFNIPNSWQNDTTAKWSDPLLSGTLGREFGPGNTDKIYDNSYYNGLRMAPPGGDLDTALNLNRSCNQYNPYIATPGGRPADPITYNPGMITNSQNPQITSFGKRTRRSSAKTPRRSFFGNSLYSQMGPVPINGYLMSPGTFNNLYAGGGQGEPPRPYQGSNRNYFINTFNPYYPVKSLTSFGLRHRKLTKKVKNKIKNKIKSKGTRSVKSGKKTKQHPHKKPKPKPKSRRMKQPKVKKSGKFVLRNGRLKFNV